MPAAEDTYPMPANGWTCFHCGETFTTVGSATDHFGAEIGATPGCLLRVQLGDERGWLMQFRRLEADLIELRHQRDVANDEAESLAGQLMAWATRFPGCRTVHAAFNLYDSMEGRAFAAEEQLAKLRSAPGCKHGMHGGCEACRAEGGPE